MSLNILLVEDFPPGSHVMKIVLSKLGHKVDFIDDAAIAIERFKTSTYDIVFTDISMPIMDGFELTEKLRKIESEEKRVATPIIGLTAMQKEMIEKIDYKKIKMNDILYKPFDITTLKDIISNNLGG